MATVNSLSQAELLSRLSSITGAAGGTSVSPDGRTVTGSLRSIEAKWLLGGRMVTSNFACTLDPAAHTARFKDSVVERSWGLPPPTLSVRTTTQRGGRVDATRSDKGVGGGGRLDFGRLRELFEQAVRDAGWKFAYEPI